MTENNNKNQKSIVPVLIPAACILFAFYYVYSTRGYWVFESVEFPYVIAGFVVILFGIIEIIELKKYFSEEKSINKKLSQILDLKNVFSSKKLIPFYIAILTFLFPMLFPILKAIITTLLYIFALRIVLKKFHIKYLLYDVISVLAIFLIMHEVLLIQLPSGALERTIISMVEKVL